MSSPPHFGLKVSYGGGTVAASVQAQPRIRFERCPLCDDENLAPLRQANCTKHPLYHPVVEPIINWLCCSGCGHVFTDGYFTAAVATVVYSKTNENQHPGWDMENQRDVAARIVERVARHVPHGDWLDVGFGNGALLFAADEFGYRSVGIDLRQRSVEALKGFGIEAYCVDIADLDSPGRFSVISMADVLEHIPFPKTALAAAHRLLREGGVLFLSMPSYQSLLWRHFDAQNANPYWGELEHYHNFSRMRLCRLLEGMGFTFAQYAISERYRIGMEIIARRVAA
jgi:SAM-dependent methyltransferase